MLSLQDDINIFIYGSFAPTGMQDLLRIRIIVDLFTLYPKHQVLLNMQ